MRKLSAVLITSLALVAAACGSDDSSADADGELSGKTITVYSGREEELIGPVLDQFEQETGAKVEVRYGGSEEMALQIDTEGENTPADVYIGQSPGAVGFLDQEGHLASLDAATLDRVGEEFRSGNGTWVGVTGRVRVLVYNTEKVSPDELPESVLDLTGQEYAGRVGVAPANGSFQDFITAMRSQLGDDQALAWLTGMATNNSPNYAKNSAIVEAVSRGEIEMGLVNHYYLAELLEEDPDVPAANHYFPEGDLGSLLIVSAAGVLQASDDAEAAEALVAFLLGDEAQTLSAAGEKEYPLVEGVAAPEGLPPLADVAAVVVDLDVIAGGLSGTTDLVDQSGIQQ